MNKSHVAVLASLSLLAAAGTALADGRASAGKEKSEDCGDCHGPDGAGDGDTIPAIAGMPVAQFKQAMADYKSGKRNASKMMIKQGNRLSEQDIADLAAYYASLKR
jgi:cytochrome c553